MRSLAQLVRSAGLAGSELEPPYEGPLCGALVARSQDGEMSYRCIKPKHHSKAAYETDQRVNDETMHRTVQGYERQYGDTHVRKIP